MNIHLLIELVKDRFPMQCRVLTRTVATKPWFCARSLLREVAAFLKDDPALQMNFLMDLTAVDYSTFGKQPYAGFLCFLGCRGEAFIPDSG